MKKTVSLFLAVLMLLGCMSITAFAEDNTTDITLTVAKEFTFDMVIPEAVSIDAAGVHSVGQAKVTNVKNATDDTVISYTAATTDFKCEDKDDIPASYYTDEAGQNAFPTTAVEVYKSKADAESIPTMYVGISETDWEAAENGTYTATVTFNFASEEKIVKQRIDFKNINGKSYFPVFSECGNVEYYDSNGTQYTSMNPAISYALVPVGTTVHSIRSKGASWTDVFCFEGESSVEYPSNASGVNQSFMTNNLVDGNESTEHVLRIDGNPQTREAIPTYNGVSLTDIWNAYKESGSFFTRNVAFILSETAQSSSAAIRFDCATNSWSSTMLSSASTNGVCIVRDFTAQAVQ